MDDTEPKNSDSVELGNVVEHTTTVEQELQINAHNEIEPLEGSKMKNLDQLTEKSNVCLGCYIQFLMIQINCVQMLF